MVDLSPRWMLVKAGLFLALASLAAAFLLWQNPDWTTAACLGALTWGACRAYYFLFHAIQHWIDPRFRFRGLVDALAQLRRKTPPAS